MNGSSVLVIDISVELAFCVGTSANQIPLGICDWYMYLGLGISCRCLLGGCLQIKFHAREFDSCAFGGKHTFSFEVFFALCLHFVQEIVGCSTQCQKTIELVKTIEVDPVKMDQSFVQL